MVGSGRQGRRVERSEDEAGSGDDRPDQFRTQRTEIELVREAAQRADERGALPVTDHILVGFRRDVGLWRCLHRDGPAFAKSRRGGARRGCGAFARRLHAMQGSQHALHLAHHERGLRAATMDVLGLPVRLDGEAEALHGVCIGCYDLGGESGLEGVGGAQHGDGSDGRCVPFGAFIGRIDDRRREQGAQGCEDLAADGSGEVVEGLHGGPDRLVWRRQIVLVYVMSTDIMTN
jgi:hypothetical protein